MERIYTSRVRPLTPASKEPVSRQEAPKSPLQRKYEAFKKRYKVQ